MKIVFIVTSFWSYGELLIAMEFAENLRGFGNEVLFIIPPTHKENVVKRKFRYVTLIPKSRKFNRLIFMEIEESFKPDIIILSDFLNYGFAEQHYGILRKDLNVFSCKMATFDNFNWLLERKCMDTYGFVSDVPQKINIADYGERILPCPLVDPRNLEKNTGYRYSLVNNFINTSALNKTRLREKYGFNNIKGDKTILISYAKWQESHIDYKNIDGFIELSNELFDELAIQLSRYYTVICIGKEDNTFENYENIKSYKSMPSKTFDEFVAISDMYIGRNMTSTSMIRIALSNVYCVNIINSITDSSIIEEKKFGNIDYAKSIDDIYMYKYMMFSVGWYNFLKPLFEDNEYAKLIYVMEQFQMNRNIELIHEILNSKEEYLSMGEKVNNLKEVLGDLPTPEQIVKEIIKK